MTDSEPRRLHDRAAIHDLLARLARAQDDRDWPTLTGCFEPGIVYDHPGGQLVGVDAVVERSRRALSPLDASQHLIGTILVTFIDDMTATSTSYFHSQHVRTGAVGGDNYAIAGTYRDQLSRRSGEWLVARRTQEYTWRQGNPEVTRRPADDSDQRS